MQRFPNVCWSFLSLAKLVEPHAVFLTSARPCVCVCTHAHIYKERLYQFFVFKFSICTFNFVLLLLLLLFCSAPRDALYKALGMSGHTS